MIHVRMMQGQRELATKPSGITDLVNLCLTGMQNSTRFAEAHAFNTNGCAVFLDTPQILKLHPNLMLQSFVYGVAGTKPWLELDRHNGVLTLFREFGFVRPAPKTDKFPVNLSVPTGLKGAVYKGLSFFFSDNTLALLRKAETTLTQQQKEVYYQRALASATTHGEYTDAMEALINHHAWRLRALETVAIYHCPQSLECERRQILQQQDQCIDQLPNGYHSVSSTARRLQTVFDQVWDHIEQHELTRAWDVFTQGQVFEENEIEKLIQTSFVQRCLPHFVAMWHQLKGLFLLNGGHGLLVQAENEGTELIASMRTTLECLEKHQFPEAQRFNEGCIEPLLNMQRQVKSVFQQASPDAVRTNMLKRYADCEAASAQRVSASYRCAVRGSLLERTSVCTEAQVYDSSRVTSR